MLGEPIAVKYEISRGYHSLMLSFEGNPFTQGHKISSAKTRVLGATDCEDFMILVCIIKIQSQSVTDGQADTGQSDGQTDVDAWTMAKTR